MNKRLTAVVTASVMAAGAAMINVAPAQAGDNVRHVDPLVFPTPKAWGIGHSGWSQSLGYLNGELVKLPCRNALHCNSLLYVHLDNGTKNAELLQQAFRGNAKSARFNFNGSVEGFAGTGLKIRKSTLNKTWRVTTLSGMRNSDQIDGKAVVVEWRGRGNHHRVAAVEYLGTDQFLAKHPLSMKKLIKGAKAMAAPTGGAVTLLTDV